MDVPTRVSLICTVRDEADTIAALLRSMLAQTHPADEIIVNDCGSRDATAAIVQNFIADGHPIRLVQGGTNIPTGRNNAILHAQGPLIASTDAGLTLDPHWLAHITAPLQNNTADVVGGFFRPAPHTHFENILAATNYRNAIEIDPDQFLPFGKSMAFRKTAWQHVGGYPTWANHCEDILFDLALKRANYRFAFAPHAIVHFQPRSSLPAFARQYYLYARGDGVANLWPRRHAIRYLTYITGLTILAATRRTPALLSSLLVGAAIYCWPPLQRLRNRTPQLRTWQLASSLPLIALIRITGDIAKMLGYPVGITQRLRNPALRETVRAFWHSDA